MYSYFREEEEEDACLRNISIDLVEEEEAGGGGWRDKAVGDLNTSAAGASWSSEAVKTAAATASNDYIRVESSSPVAHHSTVVLGWRVLLSGSSSPLSVRVQQRPPWSLVDAMISE